MTAFIGVILGLIEYLRQPCNNPAAPSVGSMHTAAALRNR